MSPSQVLVATPIEVTPGSTPTVAVRNKACTRPITLLTLAVFVVTFAFRAVRLATSWDIHVDEITYLRIAEEAAAHGHIRLYGEPFYLHPPGFFYLEALFVKIVAPTGYIIEQIYTTRYLIVLLAAFSAVLILVIGQRLAGRGAGLVASTIFALDPFVIRTNSRNMLETPALFWVLLGYAALITWDGRGPARWRLVVGAGAFGMALLTKDMTAFLTLLPLGLCFVTGWAIGRRQAFFTGLLTVAVYALYPLITFLVGDFDYFADQKLRGLMRFTGAVKESGYKREGGPSLIDSISQNLEQFITTYAIILLGALALLILFWFGGARLRLLMVWVASAYALLTYSIIFGTLEEQFFYFLVVPAIPGIVVAASVVLRTTSLSTALHRTAGYLSAVICVAFSLWSGYIWLAIHTSPDDGYPRVRNYMLSQIPAGSRVGVTTEPAVFLMDGFASGSWGTPAALRENRAEYVLVSTKEMAQGLGYADPTLGDWLKTNGEAIFSFTGRSNGTLILYALPPAPLAAAP